MSWLFRGEIEHRDSLGTHERVLPGELNLMTAGRGIAHSEVSTPTTGILHGVQLWVALPPDERTIAPGFRHYAAPAVTDAGATWRVFLGELGGQSSPVPTAAPLLGAELSLAAGSRAHIALSAGEAPCRALIIGGTPMRADLVMWWNFVGGTHEEIVQAHTEWQREIEYDGDAAPEPRFGRVVGYDGDPLPAPRLPGGRLHPRRPN